MEIFEQINELAQSTTNTYLKEAQKKGKKVIGYFCSYIPEEIIHAAGFIPYRMRAVGSTGTSMGDIYYSPLNCTFVRHCFDKALRGEFNFLDGIIFMNGCDHLRRMYDNWRYAREDYKLKVDFIHMFIAPHIVGVNAHNKYVDEIIILKKSFEKHFKVTITDKSLKKSISLYNTRRRLLNEIYEKRKRLDVPISGAEVLSTMLAITAIPVEKANAILKKVIKYLLTRVVSSKSDLRILIAAGCIEEIDHMKMIESSGAIIVTDNICLGSRQFHLEIRENKNSMDAIAKRYLNHLSCPRMIDCFPNRMKFITDSIKKYKIDAVITEKLKFCDLWGGEIFLLRKEAKRIGFPILALERELYGGGVGQMKTRVQAFLEQVKNKKETDLDMVRFAGSDYKGRDEDAIKYLND